MPSRKEYARVALVAIAYFLAHRIAFIFPDSQEILMLVWPAGGIGLAAFLLNPRRLWPMYIVALTVSGITADVFFGGRTFLTGLGYMAANVVESVGCASLILYRATTFQRFSRVREVVLLILGAVVVNGLTACLGAATSSFMRGASFADAWWSWYVADGLGILIAGPFLITWAGGFTLAPGRIRLKDAAEFAACMIIWSGAALLIFDPITVQTRIGLHPYVLIALLAWPAIRFGQRGVTLAIILLCGIAISHPHTPGILIWGGNGFPRGDVGHLLELQLFLGYLGVAGYLMAAGYSSLKRAEVEIAESRTFLSSIVDSTSDLIWSVDAVQFRLQTFNASLKNHFLERYAVAIEVGDPLEKLFAAESAIAAWYAMYRRVLIEGRYSTEYTTHDGSRLLELNFNLLKRQGETFGISVFGKDITERNRAEEQLRKLSLAVEQSPASIVITDTSGNIEYVNPKFTRVTGYTREEAAGKNPRILKSGETPPEAYRAMWETLQAGKEWRGEFSNRKKSGELFWEVASISPVKDASGVTTNFVAVKEDVTDLKRADAALRQSQKLESIGTLAGGIAHDFNNVLAGIVGYAEMSLQHAAKGSVLENNLQKVLKASDRAAQLIRQILTFSRKAKPQSSVIRLLPVITEIRDLLRASIPSSVTIESDLQEDAKPVLADSSRIHEALLNIATNAVHAMGRKGTLTLRLRTDVVDEEVYGQSGKIPPGSYTIVEVADTGSGMDPDTLSRAFEPFFTTKSVGEGTGLGLSVVLGIVQAVGGDLRVETEPGKGSTFSIYLPATEEHQPAQEGAASTVQVTGSGRVLFVDDESMLVDMAKTVLTKMGYSVVGMTDSREALEYFRTRAADIDILVTDQTMPGLTGIDLAREIVNMRRDLPIILCTGYSSDITNEEMKALGIGRVLMKPYRQAELNRIIRELLDRNAFGNRQEENTRHR